MSPPQPALARRLTTTDAILIGLGSMIGAGVFSAFAPAAAAAGAGLLVGLALAAVIAYCNATASAQLAAEFPTSGGTYIYGRERLGPWWGFLAGWSFVVGKTASCAAMALTVTAYTVPSTWQKPVAISAVTALAAINYRGVSRTAAVTKVIVLLVLAVLAIVAAASFVDTEFPPAAANNWSASGWYGIMQSAGLLFFAFAGYARIATLGEEVRNPRRTIPRAIVAALLIAVAIYLVLAVGLLSALGVEQLASAAAPLELAVSEAGWLWALPVVKVGAALAALGALLALLTGVSRTLLAMARHGDMPVTFAAVHPRFRVPHHGELAVAAAACGLILAFDIRGAIGFSSFGVLLYYFVANLAAFTQPAAQRRYPRAMQLLGAVGCAALAATLPATSVIAGVAVIAVGLGLRLITRHLNRT